MAERRMFAKSIIKSGRFLKMPPTARLLYYDLGMFADDDGIVEAYSVMTSTKANEDDLRVLVAKGFIQILNEDLVSLITDWSTNNQIRSDRYHPSIYKDLLLQFTTGKPLVNQMTTIGIPNGNHLEPEVSIGKDSIVKDSIGEENIKKTKPVKHKYGEYQNVLFTDDEYQKLQDEFPADYAIRIDNLSSYMASTGKSYKNHLATIRNWARKNNDSVIKPKATNKPGDNNIFLRFAMGDSNND